VNDSANKQIQQQLSKLHLLKQRQRTLSQQWWMHCAGLSKSMLEQQGVSCQQAFDGLVSFVNSKTQPGQTPAIVAHHGFDFNFPLMEAALLRSALVARRKLAAAAAAAAEPEAAGNSSSSDTSSDTSSSTSRRRRQPRLAAADNSSSDTISATSSDIMVTKSSDTSSSTSRHRRQTRNQQGSTGTTSSGAISTAPAAAIHAGWPDDWLFHDTRLLARCVYGMEPRGSPLESKIRSFERGECSSGKCRATDFVLCNRCAP
jgi:hypothetical protein